tara:strand:- start:148 stop:699 length:552 start_codon:yes stop_codon:yes gene_type:complete
MIEIVNFSDKFSEVKKIKLHNFVDSRGELSKIYTNNEIKKIVPKIDEVYFSNSKKGVIRGIHFQRSPYALTKLVTCVSGKIIDLFIDLRKKSKTFGSYETIELSDTNNLGLIIPKGFGHGYSVISESATVLYCQSGEYNKDFEDGINPLSLEIDWGTDNIVISEKDKSLPNFNNTDERFYLDE